MDDDKKYIIDKDLIEGLKSFAPGSHLHRVKCFECKFAEGKYCNLFKKYREDIMLEDHIALHRCPKFESMYYDLSKDEPLRYDDLINNKEFWDFFLKSVEISIPFETAIRESLELSKGITLELEKWLSDEKVKVFVKGKYNDYLMWKSEK